MYVINWLYILIYKINKQSLIFPGSTISLITFREKSLVDKSQSKNFHCNDSGETNNFLINFGLELLHFRGRKCIVGVKRIPAQAQTTQSESNKKD